MTERIDPPLRITPTFFYLLLTLVDGESHGYAMAQRVEERSEGAVSLGPGSLYWSLHRLADTGLIEEVAADEASADEERRRTYRLTDLGRRILEQEVATLSRVVEFARSKRVV